MASPIGSKGSVDVQTDSRGSSIRVQISETAGIKAENLSLSTWGASFVLANHLHKLKLPSHAKAHDQDWILELGAGTGLVGITASCIWKASVVLTDLPGIVPGLTANIALNGPFLSKSGGSASCGSLDWRSPS